MLLLWFLCTQVICSLFYAQFYISLAYLLFWPLFLTKLVKKFLCYYMFFIIFFDLSRKVLQCVFFFIIPLVLDIKVISRVLLLMCIFYVGVFRFPPFLVLPVFLKNYKHMLIGVPVWLSQLGVSLQPRS